MARVKDEKGDDASGTRHWTRKEFLEGLEVIMKNTLMESGLFRKKMYEKL